MTAAEIESPQSRRTGLGPALWILILAGVFVAAATAWRVQDMLSSRGSRAVGDGEHPATYGFALTPSLVPLGEIAGCGLPRDGLPVLDQPALLTVSQVDSIARRRRDKYLVASDRVIGVVLGGRARAYPLRVLNWHEIVNDTLGGRAIAVTYSPLCDAAVVFDRCISRSTGSRPWTGAPPAGRERVDAEVVEFGHSGLLYNSDLLMYDRRPGHAGESLWSQVQARAVTGPAAAESLRLAILPCALAHWGDWRAGHPATTVLARDPARAERYARDPYVNYYGSDELRFPVHPLPTKDGLPYKTPCLAVDGPTGWTVYPLPVIRSHADRQGVWRTEAGGRPLALACRDDPPVAFVQTSGEGQDATLPVVNCFWFAWYAMHPHEGEIAR